MAMGMTPLALILAGGWGAVFTSCLFFFVWLVSMVWILVKHGSPKPVNVFSSAAMVVAWPGMSTLFGLTW